MTSSGAKKYAIKIVGVGTFGPFDDEAKASAWAAERSPRRRWKLIELRDPWLP